MLPSPAPRTLVRWSDTTVSKRPAASHRNATNRAFRRLSDRIGGLGGCAVQRRRSGQRSFSPSPRLRSSPRWRAALGAGCLRRPLAAPAAATRCLRRRLARHRRLRLRAAVAAAAAGGLRRGELARLLRRRVRSSGSRMRRSPSPRNWRPRAARPPAAAWRCGIGAAAGGMRHQRLRQSAAARRGCCVDAGGARRSPRGRRGGRTAAGGAVRRRRHRRRLQRQPAPLLPRRRGRRSRDGRRGA